MADEAVGHLIGAEGIDLTLIGPLASLSETATDRLTLESLSGDVAALDWQTPEEILRGLAEVNFHAQRAPHPHDAEAPSPKPGVRQVFAFDMRRFRKPSELVTALSQLNSRRQVRTFAIGFGTSGGKEIVPRDARNPGVQVQETAGKGMETHDIRAQDMEALEVHPQAQSAPLPRMVNSDGSSAGGSGRSTTGTESPHGALDLDDLLDQLDRADP